MNILFEEDGSFKVGHVMTEHDASYQVEDERGKRAKIKTGNVLLKFASPLPELMPKAEAIAADIDVDFLWQACGTEEFAFTELAREYFGREPKAEEATAIALKLHGAPIYFHKKGKGRYRAANEETLKAALAGAERRRKQDEQRREWAEMLARFELPPAIASQAEMLACRPDKNTIEWKALNDACSMTGLSAAQLLHRVGAIASPHDYHVGLFTAEYLSHTADDAAAAELSEPSGLSTAEVAAFSIDDADTTEIDDAFSVTRLADARARIGIHIAAPSLYFDATSPLERWARERASTVYHPAGKFTMLPEGVIARATLQEGRTPATCSYYAEIDTTTLEITRAWSTFEHVPIAANLRLHTLEGSDTPWGDVDEARARDLDLLHRFALALKQTRTAGRPPEFDRQDYSFSVQGERVTLTPRVRGSPVDVLVAELMIHVNNAWGALLAANNLPAIYRVQSSGRTSMTTEVAPHEGLNVPSYAWSSSPLRRYIDLVNQRQLRALLAGEAPVLDRRARNGEEIAREFELKYDAYNEFQRQMERYWTLKWLEQQGIDHFTATVMRENLLRAEALPLIVRAKGVPNLAPGTRVRVALQSIDYWSREADWRFAGLADADGGGA